MSQLRHPIDDVPADRLAAAQRGDRAALTEIIQHHRPWIYNIAHKMLWNTAEAEDVTQEVLVKMLRNLPAFEGRSSFGTWLYRILVNHILNLKRTAHEEAVGSFADFAGSLDRAPHLPFPQVPQPERDLLVEEAKVACLSAMLQCLSREQRIAYVLGHVFEIPDHMAADMLELSPESFRKRLSRARTDLHAFISGQCGLVSAANPCRCAHKTGHFIRAGVIDPARLKFHANYSLRIREIATPDASKVFAAATEKFPNLYRDHPFADPPSIMRLLRASLAQTELQDLFSDPAHGES